MTKTHISWATHSWNPVTGCTPVSEGCANCYARAMAKRLQAAGNEAYRDGFAVTVHQDRLEEPLRWRKPRRVFVVSMGDLFHGDVPTQVIRHVWSVMISQARHTFMVLTKRPERMLEFIATQEGDVYRYWDHIWLGVTAENQAHADERIPILLETPAAHRFVSVEPMLSRVSLRRWFDRPNHPDWVICGGESGPRRREMHESWALDLRDQCLDYDVPFHFKQHSGPRPGWRPELFGELYRAVPPFEGEG